MIVKTLLNIIKQFFIKKRSKVLLNKMYRRFSFKSQKIVDLNNWLIENEISLDNFLKELDNNLWNESNSFEIQILKYSKEKLKNINVKLGGGACTKLIYFLVRFLKPKVTIETGVASGMSSLAILKAIEKNKIGKLYSSDFPYFRLKNPEKYIGVLVDKLKYPKWRLEIEGDMLNLKKFVKEIRDEDGIDFFHYDSDKTYDGKKKSFRILKKLFKPESILIFDDIQDDNFFYDLTSKVDANYRVFKVGNKHVGLIGNFF